jgi:hypothetical protein
MDPLYVPAATHISSPDAAAVIAALTVCLAEAQLLPSLESLPVVLTRITAPDTADERTRAVRTITST